MSAVALNLPEAFFLSVVALSCKGIPFSFYIVVLVDLTVFFCLHTTEQQEKKMHERLI